MGSYLPGGGTGEPRLFEGGFPTGETRRQTAWWGRNSWLMSGPSGSPQIHLQEMSPPLQRPQHPLSQPSHQAPTEGGPTQEGDRRASSRASMREESTLTGVANAASCLRQGN